MPKWFVPAAAVCGLMFAASPIVIAWRWACRPPAPDGTTGSPRTRAQVGGVSGIGRDGCRPARRGKHRGRPPRPEPRARSARPVQRPSRHGRRLMRRSRPSTPQRCANGSGWPCCPARKRRSKRKRGGRGTPGRWWQCPLGRRCGRRLTPRRHPRRGRHARQPHAAPRPARPAHRTRAPNWHTARLPRPRHRSSRGTDQPNHPQLRRKDTVRGPPRRPRRRTLTTSVNDRQTLRTARFTTAPAVRAAQSAAQASHRAGS